MPVLYRSGRQGHGAGGLPQDAKHHGGSVTRRPIPMQFVARQAERCEIDRLVTSAAAGRGGAVVVAGEAGIGKSALVDEAVGRWMGLRCCAPRAPSSSRTFSMVPCTSCAHRFWNTVWSFLQFSGGRWRRCSVSVSRHHLSR
ncbi:ATP-binding protein [Streptomyces sp. NPDC050619]|uniref:ATP-binding protein n=1 Tax=Streptomyces sp. NPDC050619 TaxID=3157214 RepID=UPI003448ADD3